MRATNHLQRLACAAALVFGLLLACSAMFVAPAHATGQRAEADSASLTLLNGTTFTYASTPAPKFQVVVTLATKLTTNTMNGPTVQLENGQKFASVNGPTTSPDGLTLTWDVTADSAINTFQPPSVGAHTAIASYTNLDTGVTTQSNPVSFTITKIPLTMYCGANSTGGASLLKAGQPTKVGLTAGSTPPGVPLDWTQGTATITFSGPTTRTYPNLQPDSNGSVTVTAPTVLGQYVLTCSFSGTSYYTPAQASSGSNGYIVSDMSALGGVQLYTNPTTFTPNHSIQMYLVFQAASGLPTPTGQFNVVVGVSTVYYTQSINVSSHGDALITFGPIPNMGGATKIEVHYFGDIHYTDQIFSFPLTNPAIPGGSGSSGGSGGSGGGGAPAQPKASVTTSTTASTTATDSATSSTSATPASGQVALSATASPLGGALGWLVAALVGLLALGGGVGGVVFWRSRRKAASIPTASGWPARSSPLDEETAPRRTPDRW